MCSISVCPKNGIAACCLRFVGDTPILIDAISCHVPSQIIPKSRIVHLADKQILKRHILSYPKIIVSKNPPGGGGGGRGGSIPGPWTNSYQAASKGLCDKQTTRNVFKLLYDVTGALYRSINHPRVLGWGVFFFFFSFLTYPILALVLYVFTSAMTCRSQNLFPCVDCSNTCDLTTAYVATACKALDICFGVEQLASGKSLVVKRL